jgi:hypothetical protein
MACRTICPATAVMPMPEAVNTVWIKRSAQDTNFYHLRPDCSQLPDDESRYRSVAREKLNDSYQLCKDCDPEYERDHETIGTIDCPQCGDEVSTNGLRSHLPCGGGEG